MTAVEIPVLIGERLGRAGRLLVLAGPRLGGMLRLPIGLAFRPRFGLTLGLAFL
jgi:hypothetical protein